MKSLTLVLREESTPDAILAFGPCTPRKEVFLWLSDALKKYKCSDFLESKGGGSRGLQPTGHFQQPEDVLPITPHILAVANPAKIDILQITTVSFQFGYKWGRGTYGAGNSVTNAETAISAERHGIENPNWRKQVAQGENATTPFSGRRETIEMRAGSATLTWATGDETWFDSRLGHIVPIAANGQAMASEDLASRAEAGALKKLHKYILSTQQGADVGESLAEIFQAMRMVGRPLGGLRDLVERTEARSAYNSKFARFVSESKNASQMSHRIEKYRLANPENKEAAIAAGKLYLEFMFGWRPLAKDLCDAFEELIESKLKALKKQKRFSYRDDFCPVHDSTVVPDANYFRFNRTETQTHVATVRFIVGFTARAVKAKEKLSYLRRIGLGPQRWVPTLYAVIPYSWLLDYFTALNDVIDALFANTTAVAWVCRTDRYERNLTVVEQLDASKTLDAIGGAQASITENVPFVSSLRDVVVHRSIPEGLVPDLQFSIIDTANNPGRMKILTALILSKVKYPSIFSKHAVV